MANFIIPKGKDYTFIVNVKERESFLPQDLTNMSSAIIEFTLLSNSCTVMQEALTVVDALNGVLTCTLPAAKTDLLTVERGSKVDGYYLKPTHQALITIKFTDNTSPIFTMIDKVYIAPTSCII